MMENLGYGVAPTNLLTARIVSEITNDIAPTNALPLCRSEK